MATQQATTDTAADIAAIAGELVNSAEASAREVAARRIAAVIEQARSEANPQPKPLRTMHFGAVHDLYVLKSDAKAWEVGSQLDMRLSQLTAILSHLYGEGFESFKNMGDENQENTLWACADMARECQELSDVLRTLQGQEAAKTA